MSWLVYLFSFAIKQHIMMYLFGKLMWIDGGGPSQVLSPIQPAIWSKGSAPGVDTLILKAIRWLKPTSVRQVSNFVFDIHTHIHMHYDRGRLSPHPHAALTQIFVSLHLYSEQIHRGNTFHKKPNHKEYISIWFQHNLRFPLLPGA